MPDVIRIAYLPNGGFVLPIISRIQGSSSPTVRSLADCWHASDLSLLGASLSTKTTMLSMLHRRLSSAIESLVTEVCQCSDLQLHISHPYSWVPRERLAPYRVLLELDCFLFEFRSAYDMLKNFLVSFAATILSKNIVKTDVNKVLTDAGVPVNWISRLQRLRNFFIHEHTPWLAFQVNSLQTPDIELIFLSHADAKATNPDEAIKLADLTAIYSGFSDAVSALQDWALNEIKMLESLESA